LSNWVDCVYPPNSASGLVGFMSVIIICNTLES
jgi:hypothetical protein